MHFMPINEGLLQKQILHNINTTLKDSEHCIELESRAQINLTSRKFHVKGRYYK